MKAWNKSLKKRRKVVNLRAGGPDEEVQLQVVREERELDELRVAFLWCCSKPVALARDSSTEVTTKGFYGWSHRCCPVLWAVITQSHTESSLHSRDVSHCRLLCPGLMPVSLVPGEGSLWLAKGCSLTSSFGIFSVCVPSSYQKAINPSRWETQPAFYWTIITS